MAADQDGSKKVVVDKTGKLADKYNVDKDGNICDLIGTVNRHGDCGCGQCGGLHLCGFP